MNKHEIIKILTDIADNLVQISSDIDTPETEVPELVTKQVNVLEGLILILENTDD